MKHKGKVREKKSDEKDKDGGSKSTSSSPLMPLDHTQQCHRYTAVLMRSEEEGVSVDEIANLQSDLEILLANVAKRLRLLDSDSSSKPVGSRCSSPAPSLKRGRGSEVSKTAKKFKGESPGKPAGKAKAQANPEESAASPAVDSPASGAGGPKLPPRNDLPERFWATVEPYCTDIGPEHLKVLEKIMASHEDDADYYKVPALGRHYSVKWATEDLVEEQKQGARASGDKKKSSSTPAKGAATRTLRRAESSRTSQEDGPVFGPLTQRLVSGLVEQNVIAPVSDAQAQAQKTECKSGEQLTARQAGKALGAANSLQLERRLKHELEGLEMLEGEDGLEDGDDPEDEVVCELKRLQTQLEALSQNNLVVTRRLFKQAKDQMSRQQTRRNLVAVDAEIMDNWKRLQSSRQKKKSLPKKERETMWRVIKERDKLIKQLDKPY